MAKKKEYFCRISNRFPYTNRVTGRKRNIDIWYFRNITDKFRVGEWQLNRRRTVNEHEYSSTDRETDVFSKNRPTYESTFRHDEHVNENYFAVNAIDGRKIF